MPISLGSWQDMSRAGRMKAAVGLLVWYVALAALLLFGLRRAGAPLHVAVLIALGLYVILGQAILNYAVKPDGALRRGTFIGVGGGIALGVALILVR